MLSLGMVWSIWEWGPPVEIGSYQALQPLNFILSLTWSTYQHKARIIPVSPTEWWNCHFWGTILVHQIAAMMGVATQHHSGPDQWKKFVWHFFGHYFPFFSISGSLFLRRWSIDSCADCFCLAVQGKMLWRDTWCMKSLNPLSQTL